MGTTIEYSCHTITNIKHGRRLSLQLMINSSFICNYSNACLQCYPTFSTRKSANMRL